MKQNLQNCRDVFEQL